MGEKLIKLIRESSRVIAFTGAGISTFSGLKDFRGEDGLCKIMEPEKIFDINIFHSDPAFFYKYARELVFDLDNIEPSMVHLELARLEQRGIIEAVITQNIDRLHQKAGSKKIIEVHGSAETGHCCSCGKEFSYAQLVSFVKVGEIPHCANCNGIIKPDITFYGEQLAEKPFIRALEESSKADLIISLGSTLVVQPAASFIDNTLGHGGKLVIVNNQPTPYDHYADLIIRNLEEFCRLVGELI
ncbi:MAG: NAD-dependent deacetylase [Spirochaetaceae bacterium]|nr:NAD-dependent deacetylase [Spirochaetaceae bacterium]